MANVVVGLAVVAAVVVAIVLVRRRQTQGSACCGDRGQAVVRTRVADRNKAHYAHETTLNIGGMTCDNCAARVENALNELPGTWATVSIATHTAVVRSKETPDLDELRAAVAHAGYVVLD